MYYKTTMMLVSVAFIGTIETKNGEKIPYSGTDGFFYMDPLSIRLRASPHDHIVSATLYNLNGELLGKVDATNFRTVEYHNEVMIKEDK